LFEKEHFFHKRKELNPQTTELCAVIERATKKRDRQTVGREEIKKMMKHCVPCSLATVFFIGASLELGVCIESKSYSLELIVILLYVICLYLIKGKQRTY